MCGLVGIMKAKGLSHNDKKVFGDLLHIDTLRGPHSTGVMSVDKDNNTQVAKKAVDGPTFLQMAEYDRTVRPHDIHVLAGHNRWATKGAVNYDNAHPFTHGDITMMHNGTLRHQNGLEKGYKFGTDSEWIAHNLSLSNVTDVTKELAGAFALVWFDARDNSMNFVRNKERTLYVAWDDADDMHTVVWASESWFIDTATGRGHDNYKLCKPFLLSEHTHLKVVVTGDTLTWTVENVEEYVPPLPKVYLNTVHSVGKGFGDAIKKQNRSSCSQLPTGYPKFGAEIDVIPHTFKLYTGGKKKKGKIEGLYTYTSKGGVEYLHTELHGVSQKEYDSLGTKHRARVINYSLDYETVYVSLITGSNVVHLDDDGTTYYDVDSPKDWCQEDEERLGYVQGFNKQMLSKYSFDKLTADGCAYCTSPLPFSDAEDVTWIDNLTPMCDDCGPAHESGVLC